MPKNTIQGRVQQLREYYGLSKKDFSLETGMNLSSIYRIEGGKTKISKAFLNILKIRFAANPNWILTGEGKMLMDPEEFITLGIALLGSLKLSEGFLKVLKDPKFSEFRSYVAMDNLVGECFSEEQLEFLQQAAQLWQQGDERIKLLLTQFVKSLAEVATK